jgi:hypothetical protein
VTERTWRPRLGRIIAYGLAVVIVASAAGLAVIMPPTWGTGDRVGFVAIALAIAGGLHLLGRCRLTADDEGLTVVNAARVQFFPWDELRGAAMVEGASWLALYLDDDASVNVMAIQSADGDRARRAAAEVGALVAARAAEPAAEPEHEGSGR